MFLPVLLKLFNTMLQIGYFPESWAQGVIIPLHKKGDINNVNNYRGITLISHLAKLFTSLLNKRLLKWSAREDIVTDAQFGFKPGFGTSDAIFALQSLIINSIEQNKRPYCAFIDYSKAFDSINHRYLWHKLWKSGSRGRLLNVISSIYDNVRSCVKLNGKLSAMFDLHVGLLQGESLSPMLYSLFVNDMESEFINSDCQSYPLQLLNLFMLMYADDTVLFSEDATDL